jgi:hypothetical protein
LARCADASIVIEVIKRLCATWRAAALREVLEIRGLMRLLMKPRNTAATWTAAEKAEIIGHLKEISRTLPMLALFCLPGGSLLLPIFVSFLDRRRTRRIELQASRLDVGKQPELPSEQR